MRKSSFIFAAALMLIAGVANATITNITIKTINGTVITGATFTSTDWNKNDFSRRIPLPRAATNQTYRIKFDGDWLDTHTKIEITQSNGTGTVSGVTVTLVSKASKTVTLDIRVNSSVSDGTLFRLRFRYLAEVNCGEPGGCGDNVQFRVVNKGTINSISINPVPARDGNAIVMTQNQSYTLTFNITGATGTETVINSGFNNTRFTTPFLTNKTATSFQMVIAPTAPNTTGMDLQSALNLAFADTDVDAEFKSNIIDGRYIKYTFNPSLPNSGNNVDLKNVRGVFMPDLQPVSFNPAVNPFIRVTSGNSFIGGGTNSYHPVDASFCPLGVVTTPFTDGQLTGRQRTITLPTHTFGVINKGKLATSSQFEVRIVRFRQLADTGNVNLGTLIGSTTITTANNIPPDVTRSANVSRGQVDIFEIDGKTGCYIKRPNGTNVAAPFEEAAFKIIVDPTNTVIESNEANNIITVR